MNNVISDRQLGRKLVLFTTILLAFFTSAQSQDARVYEQKESIKTYPFGDPDPVTYNREIYPYFRFDGYSTKGEIKKWNVVYLENSYIKVSVLPGVGGKVWGAVEKSTGQDFIYKNDVLKFRDIGLRGAWTSGGIEFNFGVQGHTPNTATPVDYLIKKNQDGSVSCYIGAIDLASRTRWRVEIRLPKNEALFQTKGHWYNSTTLNRSYYYWSNAAIHVSDSLQYYFPGTHFVEHGGGIHPWPITKEGINISYYRNTPQEGGSFHVLGSYANYYGAYEHGRNFGFGHWSRNDEIPGKKIFTWGLSKEGSIWKHILSDTSGQYTEVQAGRLYSQAARKSGLSSPFNQNLFSPGQADQWKEDWFPVKDIGGITDASPYGTMNVTQDSSGLHIAINALKGIIDTLKIFESNKLIQKKILKLKPMDVFKTSIKRVSNSQNYVVKFGNNLTAARNTQSNNKLLRPLHSNNSYDSTSAEGLFQMGEEQFAHRQYDEALQLFLRSLKINGNNRHVLARTAEVYVHKAKYKSALKYAQQVLKNDTYDAEGNFLYGVINRKMGHLTEAKVAFGWAARSLKYRSAGREQIGEINVQQHNWIDAVHYAQRALDYNEFNVNANKVLAIAYRKHGEEQKANEIIKRMLENDPLCHFAYFEKYLLHPTQKNVRFFTSLIRNELPHETYLELAIDYYNMGLHKEAEKILEKSPSYPIINYWLAYLNKDNAHKSQEYLDKALAASPKLVFPFRHETIPVLKWASNQKIDWKTSYYLGLIMWSKGRDDEALSLLSKSDNQPDFAPFYITRSKLFKGKDAEKAKKDLKRALNLDQSQWRTYRSLASWDMSHDKIEDALHILEKGHKKFSNNYYLGVQYANVLLKSNNYKQSYITLRNMQVLPAEGARQAHSIFQQSLYMLAMQNMRNKKFDKAIDNLKRSREWPQNLGAGKPHNPDERIQNFLAANTYEHQNKSELADSLYSKVLTYSKDMMKQETNLKFNFNNLISLLVYERYGKIGMAENVREQLIQSLDHRDAIISWLKAGRNDQNGEINSAGKKLLKSSNASIPTWLEAYLKLREKGIISLSSKYVQSPI